MPQTFTTIDGLTLTGHLALPAKRQGPFPAVLLLVGSGPIDRYENVPGALTVDGKSALLFKGIEDRLVANGIAVFAYDKRGIAPKDSTFLDVMIDPNIYDKAADANHLFADALRAFDHLKGLPQADSERIGILGQSEGTGLAMKIAEQRPEVRSLFMLGIWTRPFEQVLYYQDVTNMMRIFHLIDASGSGFITQGQYQPFSKEDPKAFQKWGDMVIDQKTVPGLSSQMDKTGDGKISDQEWMYFFEQNHKRFEAQVHDPAAPWSIRTPREFLMQYEAEGEYLSRHLKFCEKMHVFQGEIDVQTPFEDALELKDHCMAKSTPLASFHSYPDEGHGFSPRIGLKGWKDTVGPMDPRVQQEIADIARGDLSRP